MKRAGTFKSLDPRPVATRGYTIIELMVAVAVIGVLASISIFSFTKNRGRSACYGSIRELGILLSEARMQAQSTGLPVFLRFDRDSLGDGKLRVRWERLSCTGANDSWSDCPNPQCLALDKQCPGTPGGTAETCCESFGSWIEVADTLRVATGGNTGESNLIYLDDANSALNRMCWSGMDGVNKVAIAGANKCAFAAAPLAIESITLACVDSAASNEAIEPLGDGLVQIDALTGLSRILDPAKLADAGTEE
ncbi:MAG: prepilin-type N-terminal cleavage/methylation domain-containing protein [Myxococcaceae bacterium]|nr:prepilin-type N-terminal cleavage/methylation domain-containing protein [Myxococcaceae bacterium]